MMLAELNEGAEVRRRGQRQRERLERSGCFIRRTCVTTSQKLDASDAWKSHPAFE